MGLLLVAFVVRACARSFRVCRQAVKLARRYLWKQIKRGAIWLAKKAKWLLGKALAALGAAQAVTTCYKNGKQGYLENRRKNWFKRIWRTARRCVTG